MSLLNFDAPWNAVQIITIIRKKRELNKRKQNRSQKIYKNIQEIKNKRKQTTKNRKNKIVERLNKNDKRNKLKIISEVCNILMTNKDK